MRGGDRLRGLHAIVDNPDRAAELLAAGVRIVQLRHKSASAREFLSMARRLRALTRQRRAVFIVNDRADIARLVGADGLHVGQDDLPVGEARRVAGPRAVIGVSTHTLEQALGAERDGADYIGFGPVFATASKAGALPPVGVGALREVASRVAVPVIAIGGVREENLAGVLKAGARGAAVISELSAAADPAGKARALLRICAQIRGGRT